MATTKKTAYLGTGRRKTSVARVRMTEGNGKIDINGRSVEEYFTETKDRNAVYNPLELCDMRGRVDLKVLVNGGGITGQGGAITQGIARALKQMFGLDTKGGEAANGDEVGVDMAKRLRDSHFLTRDGRMKERKKYGRKGARKSFQFSKR
jgi:small subunit ribosomal protein S9